MVRGCCAGCRRCTSAAADPSAIALIGVLSARIAGATEHSNNPPARLLVASAAPVSRLLLRQLIEPKQLFPIDCGGDRSCPEVWLPLERCIRV